MTDSESVRLTPPTLPADGSAQQERPAGDESRPLRPWPAQGPARDVTRILGWTAVVALASSLALMVAASLARQAWMYPQLKLPASGFPWAATGWHAPKKLVVVGVLVSGLLAGIGLIAGLEAVRRGARAPIRLILIAAALVVAVLAVLPPAGSTDALDYASYGRLLVLGYNPYVLTPHAIQLADPGFATAVPGLWKDQVSLYGPAATFEQYLAARLGGDSPARIVAWLKLWNAVPFAAVAYVADRIFRQDPARRLRAHLLWTANPLLIWDVIAAGHVDVIAAGFGVLGVLVVRPQKPGMTHSLLRAAAAGALIGAAADFKINYLVFGLGVAWVLRRRPLAVAAAAAGGLAVLAPTYAWFGAPAITALFAQRNMSAVDSFYRLLDLNLPPYQAYVGIAAIALVGAMAILLMWRLPVGDALHPAVRPSLALSLAWLFLWPYQLPWYDTMAICLLLFYPASHLDWLVIARMTIATLANMPGNPQLPPGPVLTWIDQFDVHQLAPTVLGVAVVALIVLAVTNRWGMREDAAVTTVGAPGLIKPRKW